MSMRSACNKNACEVLSYVATTLTSRMGNLNIFNLESSTHLAFANFVADVFANCNQKETNYYKIIEKHYIKFHYITLS